MLIAVHDPGKAGAILALLPQCQGNMAMQVEVRRITRVQEGAGLGALRDEPDGAGAGLAMPACCAKWA